MILEVRGMEKATETFVQLWGKYVTGFRQEKHCIYCLRGPSEDQIHREMASKDYQLRDGFPYFYLFAMGRGYRRDTNVHLVVVPFPGAVASVGSMYGVTFTIRNAKALRIDRLPEGWMGLPKGHATCRNFQFGVQQFGYKLPDTVAPGDFSHVPSAPIAE